METNLESNLFEEYQLDKELIYIQLQDCIDRKSISEGRPIVEKYLSVAQTDNKFIALAKQLKACERHSSEASSAAVDPTTITCTDYSLQRVQILESLQKIIDDKTYSCADAIIQKYSHVANHDEEFCNLVKQIRTQQNEERAFYYVNSLEALPNDDISNRLQLLSDIATLLHNEKNVENLNNFIKNSVPKNTCSLPTEGDIKYLNKTMSSLLSENTFSKRAKLCQKLLSFHDKFNLERIRCQQAAEKLENYKKLLLSTDKNNYQECIKIYQDILSVYHEYRDSVGLTEEGYKTTEEKLYADTLQNYLDMKDKFQKEQKSKLEKEFQENKPSILHQIQRSLSEKRYDETANQLEVFNDVAKNDPDFCVLLNNTRSVAKVLKRTRLEEKLDTIPKSDYASQMDIYKEIIELDPYDQKSIANLYKCEKELGLHKITQQNNLDYVNELDKIDNSALENISHIKEDFEDVSHIEEDFIEMQNMPVAMSIPETNLIPIEDQDIVLRLLSILDTAKNFTTKAAGAFDNAGNIINSYKNNPLAKIILGTELMDKVATGTQIAADSMRWMNDNLESAKDLVIEGNEMIAPFIAVIKNSDLVAHSCKQFINEISNSDVVNKLQNALVSLASLIVSSHYMRNVNSDISTIQTAIEKIADFQDTQFKSNIYALCDQISTMTFFKAAILENDDLRHDELIKLLRFEDDCCKLISHTKTSLQDTINTPIASFEQYEKCILPNIEKWTNYHQTLMNILNNVSKLSFALYNGSKSMEHCYAIYRKYEKETAIIFEKIRAFHQSAIQQFGIEIENARRKTEGVFGVFSRFSIIDAINYQSVEEDTIRRICDQMLKKVTPLQTEDDHFHDDVVLIMKNNRFYYFPKSDEYEQSPNSPFDIEWIVNTLREESTHTL